MDTVAAFNRRTRLKNIIMYGGCAMVGVAFTLKHTTALDGSILSTIMLLGGIVALGSTAVYRCPSCGFNLTGSRFRASCPQCGVALRNEQ